MFPRTSVRQPPFFKMTVVQTISATLPKPRDDEAEYWEKKFNRIPPALWTVRWADGKRVLM